MESAMVSFQIVDRIRRQSSWASCELCSHRQLSTRQLRRVGGVYWAIYEAIHVMLTYAIVYRDLCLKCSKRSAEDPTEAIPRVEAQMPKTVAEWCLLHLVYGLKIFTLVSPKINHKTTDYTHQLQQRIKTTEQNAFFAQEERCSGHQSVVDVW